MDETARIPRLPGLAASLLRWLPLPVVDALLARVTETIVRKHPSMFGRLGEKAQAAFLIDPVDLPFVLLLRPDRPGSRIAALRRGGTAHWDTRIAGPLAALIGLVHGSYDGDALFFSRDLVIEGDTEAALALRNAIDDTEVDLAEEFLASSGPFRPLAEPPFRLVLPFAERMTGLPLTRVEAPKGWQ